MRRSSTLLSLFVIALFMAFGLRAQAAGLFGEESFTLKNGLQVVVVPNHRAPTVTHWVWYKVGGADEERGRSGSAHFLEHLMFRGTKTQKPKEFSQLVARVGGDENAFTSWDYTAFHQTVSADQLELVMRLEADRMQNLVITDDQLKPELQVVLEEWRMRTGNQPAAQLENQELASMYLNSPYRIPVLGWPNEIKTLDVATERNLYNDWYAPNNAVLIVAGDVTVDQVRQLAEKYYGPVPSHPIKVRARLQEPDRAGDTTVTLSDSRVRQPQWERAYLAPSYRTAGNDDPYAIQVLTEILGSGAPGRVHKALVLDQGLAVDVQTWYEPDRWDLGMFGVAASARPGVTLDKLGAAADQVVRDLLEHGVTEDEVTRANNRLVTGLAYSQDDLTQPVMIIGRALCTGQTLDDVDRWPDKIGAVTAERVMAAAHALLDKKSSVVGELLPAEGGPVEPQPMAPPVSGEIR